MRNSFLLLIGGIILLVYGIYAGRKLSIILAIGLFALYFINRK